MPDEDDLEELRKQKREELESGEKEVEDQREQIRGMAAKFLTSEARSRLGNVRAADPELASAIESQIVQLGRMGQIDEMGDEELKDILRKVKGESEDTDIKFRR